MITLLSVSVGWLSFRFARVRLISEGEPIILIHGGQVIEANPAARAPHPQRSRGRGQTAQLASLDEVRWAILEDGGTITVISNPDLASVATDVARFRAAPLAARASLLRVTRSALTGGLSREAAGTFKACERKFA